MLFFFIVFFSFFFFFFSSRRRHTRCSRDWSSDVCSSDLGFPFPSNTHPSWAWAAGAVTSTAADLNRFNQALLSNRFGFGAVESFDRSAGRSEERRVGKECRSGWAADQSKKKVEDMEARVN